MEIREQRAACARFRSLRAIGAGLLLALVHVVAQAQTVTVVGKVQDQFSVLPNGGAAYRVAIKVPPSLPGVVPKLELVYTGRGIGNLGAGWSLGGLSMLTRCPRTIAQDGVRGAIRFDNNDRFCLDGQRLILVGGTYGQDGAEYRTELESFSKVVSYGVSGVGPAWFKVWTKDGQIREYGNASNTVDVRIVNGSPLNSNIKREWPLTQVSDASGNYYTVRYQLGSDGAYKPDVLGYGGNLLTGAQNFGSINFNYDSLQRPVLRYLSGTKNLVADQLKEVRVMQGTLVAKTNLSYELAGASPTERISALQVCDGATTPKCLSPLNFTYATASGGFSASTTTWALPSGATSPVVGVPTQLQTHGFGDTFEFGTPSVPVTRTQTHVAMADMNGDSLPDIYVTAYTPPAGGNPETIQPGQVYVNTGTGFSSTAIAWPLPAGVKAQKDIVDGKTIAMLIDVNGDGLPDLYKTLGPLASGNPRGEVYLNTGSGFSSTATAWGLPSAIATANVVLTNGTTQSALVDLDGDGLPDAYLTDGTNAATAYLNTGSGFSSTAKAWPLPLGAVSPKVGVSTQQQTYTYNDKQDYGGTNAVPVYRTQTHVALVDMNGDGLPDIYVTAYDPTSGGGGGTIFDGQVFMNTGIGFASADTWLLPTGIKAQKDVVEGKTIVTLIDLNGDGLPDLFKTIGPLGAGNPRGEVYFNTGTSFSTVATPWALPAAIATSNVVPVNGATQSALIDLDGDGFPDAYLTDGVNPAQVFLSNSPSLSKLARISSATAPAIDITYSKLSDPAVYTIDSGSNAGAFPVVDIAAAKTVVSSVAVANGIGGTNTTTYSYGGLKSEVAFGRGVLGFRWMNAKSVTTGIEAYTEYRQDFPFIGLPILSETRLAGSGIGGVLKRTTNTWVCQNPQTLAACTVTAGNRYFDYLSTSMDEAWDLTGVTLPSVTSAVTYAQNPQYGHATQTTVTSSDGTSKTTANEYWAPDTTTWTIGRVKRQSVTTVKP